MSWVSLDKLTRYHQKLLTMLVPVGVTFQYAGTTAPDGYLLCNGQAVSRTTYSKLFAVIGTTYGGGDGSTTFNLPKAPEHSKMGILIRV